MEFWSAEQLREEFDVIASFYQIRVGSKLYQCRSHAVIFRKGYNNQEFPDAIVCMANPGSCSPRDKSYQLPIIQDNFINVPYVVVDDDPTQRQLMRLMKMMNWNVISIINLSDLCAGNMDDFKEKHRLVEEYSYKKHSIFDDSRFKDRESLLDCFYKQSNVILAWGKDSSIRKLASNVLKKLPKERPCFFGLPYSSPEWEYRHPNPILQEKCIKWLKEMSLQLNKSECINQTN
jgi:hypothetical protein